MLEKAYSEVITVAQWQEILKKAKRDLDQTDFKILMVTIQMRGRFSSTGASLIHKTC